MKYLVSLLLLFSLSLSPLQSQEINLEIKGGDVKIIEVDKTVIVKVPLTVVYSFPFSVYAPKDAGLYFWTYSTGVVATDKGDELEISSAPKGIITVSTKCFSADFEAKKYTTRFGSKTFAIGGIDPVPPIPPVPPVPPTPIPIPTSGFRVLIVYETADKTPGLAKNVADYLNLKCIVVNKQPEWRRYDKDTLMTNESKIWQEAMTKIKSTPNLTIPWVLISDGTKGFEGQWPSTPEAQLELLKKWGGN